MVQSTRHRRVRGDRNKGSKKRPAQSKQPGRVTKKRKKGHDVEVEETGEDEQEDAEELFKVEKIVDSKPDKNGAPLYKTRWKGYSASDDTWEPSANVASTGHIDRYERQQRQKTLKKKTAGVAVIEYEDGEREMVDMKIEKFRGYYPHSSDDDRDDDSVDGDDDVNDFSIISEGEWIEILWPHANIYFPCKVMSWAPPRSEKQQKKGSKNSSRKRVFEDVDESSVSTSVQIQQKETKAPPKRSKKKYDATSQRKKKAVVTAPAKTSELEIAPTEPTQKIFLRDGCESATQREDGGSMHKPGEHKDKEDRHDLDGHSLNSESSRSSRSVERVGHGIPLFDEPEDDFGSSSDDENDSDDGVEEEEDGIHSYQHPGRTEEPKLTFEEQWTLKLKRTQELIDRDLNCENGLF